jgi:uncharacterized protein
VTATALMTAAAAVDLAIRAYQVIVRPFLPRACRFEPSCSEYAREAVRAHGAARGLWLATWRICRCHPFHPGGYDPPPATAR